MKECFIVKNGVERKADLEDIIPIINEGNESYHIINSIKDIDLAAALAHLSEENKDKIYRNMSPRISGELKKNIGIAEKRENYSLHIQHERENLLEYIGINSKILLSNCPEQIVWKDTLPEEPQLSSIHNPVEDVIENIERACKSGNLHLSYNTTRISREDIQKAFSAFNNRRDELRKIKSLRILPKHLPATALLFKEEAIENLEIEDYTPYPWPEFLEKYHALKSIAIGHPPTEFPSWIRSAVSLRYLHIILKDAAFIPDWIEELQSLTKLKLGLINCNIKTLPNCIGNLKNLAEFELFHSDIEKMDCIGNLQSLTKLILRNNGAMKTLPDSIGNLQSLTELSLQEGKNMKNIPDSIGNLKNLTKLSLYQTAIEELPDSIGDLQSLTEFSLRDNKNLKRLPESICNLNNLVKLSLCNSPIEKLPTAIDNCPVLEYVTIRGTNISSFPYLVSSARRINKSIRLIPRGQHISYRSFCNHYYWIAETVIRFNEKEWRHEFFTRKNDIELLSDEFFYYGLKLLDYDAAVIRRMLTLKIKHEHDFYRKKLMEITMEGILCIKLEYSIPNIAFLLASLVDIKNNPLETACAEYLKGRCNAFENIDFKPAILLEKECEEVRFIKRAKFLNETAKRKGFLALEKHLDHNGIEKRDIFEYALPLVIDRWDKEIIAAILDRLIAHETNPMFKNFALAKKEAVMSLYDGDNTLLMVIKLCSFFDKSIEEVIRG
jgi:Leucine-rich repeat (LRR) protein